ncbi:MAG: deoxyribonuclease IV [Lentisphaerae bacterium]|nr:deoxyribonuclease IV [Lentisphaerota bacterium]
MKWFGAHVSAQGGVDQAPLNARRIGAQAFALFVKNQKQWEARPLTSATREAFTASMQHCGFTADQVLPHAGYLINLANPDPEAHARSTASFINELARCAELGLTRLNLHPGSHLKKITPEAGIANIVRAARAALAAVPGVSIIFENTAGQGGSLGATFEELAAILEGIGDEGRVGVCLDTAHLYAAGFDLAAPGGYDAVVRRFDETVGLRRLHGIHLNDTRVECGKRVDRHALLGEGRLGWPVFEQVARDPRLDGLPIILETPDETRWAEEIRQLYARSALQNAPE